MTSPLSPKPSIADAIIADFRYETSRAAQIQERVLSEILKKNAGTEYLSRFLGDACDLNNSDSSAPSLIDEFRRQVPLVTHSDLKPFFDRIADGDRSPILTADPVDTLSLSSGTTSDGQQKYLILYKEILDASLKLAKISGAFRSRAFPIRSGKKLLDLVFSGKLTTTKGKIKTGTATTHLFRSKEFKLKYKSTNVKACSPEEVIRASNNRQAMYCHLLSSLVHREDIEFIHSTFAYSIVEALRTLESEWPRMCHDIRHGTLSGLVTDESVRDAMHANVLSRPRPDLAHSVARVCSELASHPDTPWAGLVPTIWPNCKYILSIMTGAMEPYLNKLQHYGGHLPLVSSDYGATESWIGVNTNPKAAPEDTTFTIVPTFAYFEFIPQVHADGETSEQLLGLTEVQVGQEYEIVMTTYGGLYRYRLGDIVRVTGFYNQSPQLAYVRRKNVVLTVHIDKNTEKDLQIAVYEGMDKLREHDPTIELVDFTSYASLSTDPGHYVIFVELNRLPNKNNVQSVVVEENEAHGVNESIALLQECATTIDLAFLDPGYVGSRKIHTIGPLELCLVKPGTFCSLLDRYLARGAAITQYKTPRCIPSDELRRILHSKVIASTHSSAYL